MATSAALGPSAAKPDDNQAMVTAEMAEGGQGGGLGYTESGRARPFNATVEERAVYMSEDMDSPRIPSFASDAMMIDEVREGFGLDTMKIDELRHEIRNQECVITRGETGELLRCTMPAVLRLERGDGRVLVQLGKRVLNQTQRECRFPGARCKDGQSAREVIQLMLKGKLADFTDGVVLGLSEEVLEVKKSKHFGLTTKYKSTVFHARFSAAPADISAPARAAVRRRSLPGLQIAGPIAGDSERTGDRKRSLTKEMAFGKARSEERRPSPTSPSPTDLITKEMDGKTYLFCWLTPEEMRRRAAELDIVKASPGQGVPTLALLEGHKQQRVQDSHSESAPAATLVVQPAPPAGSSCGRGGSSGSRSSLWERRQCQAKAPKLGGMRLDCSKENKEPNGGSLSMQEVLDRYDVMEKLGSGSVTTVYRATRRADRREVALKLMRSMDREMWSFMTSEYHVLAGIKHPSIIGMLDMFDTSQGPVLVMECFGAWSLGKAVPCQGLSEAVARGLFLLLAQAVNHLHQRHLLHRDIHPDNVMVSQDLKDLRLIDFNTACKDGSLTPTGLKLYSSPEILLEKATHSRASDVWSAGLCLHYALRCRLPDEVERLFKAGIFADIAGIESFADVPWPGISVECADALQRCLSALPAARPSAEELLAGDLLRDVLAEDLAQEGS